MKMQVFDFDLVNNNNKCVSVLCTFPEKDESLKKKQSTKL